MKLKGKLIMSAAALAACAATLTSTTYAWYTTNTTVDASNVSGTTADSGDASILISQDPADASGKKIWASSVSVTKANQKNATALIPLEYTGTQFNALGSTSANTDGYLEFKLYFKTAKVNNGEGTTKLYLKTFKATNADNLKESDNLIYTGVEAGKDYSKGLDAGLPTYTIDAARCLGLVMNSATVANLNSYAFDVTEGTLKDDSVKTSNQINAITYYNTVMGLSGDKVLKDDQHNLKTLGAADSEDGTDALKIAELPNAGTETSVTFKVYLNGWDKYCFDACKGQTFNFEIAFTSDAKLAATCNLA